ncbi:sigma-54-dependent transcriptional regulator [Candidatus Photodesmus anomalopis]|uniref:Flagellar regulatory protein A n=1 Tax=Candidatus Photodesmus katoptron Akat1 TaxID=1236703 RepID=S3EI92_9GAMM|nr:sigma-54 dependent transcriptional regulator [Candidatus Photodesmus katoptron]EPE37898.1 flagellar regulatory protein A [Candidatus Photodesmus katoptron Akat1]
MPGLAEILLIEDDIKIRTNLSNILEFVGERCKILASNKINELDWSKPWAGCIIGSLDLSNKQISDQLHQKLIKAYHVPLFFTGKHSYFMKNYPQYIGNLEFPLNYAQLSTALKHCKYYLSNQTVHIEKNSQFYTLVGESTAIRKVRYLIEQVSKTETNVLLIGELGTGKELIARNIHNNSSRSNSSFIPVNCTTIPSELLESELFGYEKNIFTGAITSRKGCLELAEGGTLFLDEISNISLPLQIKLVHFIQKCSFKRVGGNTTITANVRIIATTNQNLKELRKNIFFREELYYELNAFPIEVPSLRNRKEDIPLILQNVIKQISADNKQPINFTSRAIHSLIKHDWPGNIQELLNLVKRMIILNPNELLDINHLPLNYRHDNNIPTFQPRKNLFNFIEEEEEEERNALADIFSENFNFEQTSNYQNHLETYQPLPTEGINLKDFLAEVEVHMINQALETHDGIVTKAANILGIPRTTLVDKMKKYNLHR